MKYRQWIRWVRSKPFSTRWFIYLVLFRPVIDVFYFMKEVSPVVSPLYIVGVLTPVAVVASLLSPSTPRRIKSRIDGWVYSWCWLACANVVVMLIFNFSVSAFALAIKLTLPVYLYAFLRRFIQDRRDLIGIFQTVLYSAVFPLAQLPLQVYLNPRAFSSLSVSRGGGFRFSGGYADVMNYSILIVGAVLVLGFYYLAGDSLPRGKKGAGSQVIVAIGIGVVGLSVMKHTVSWAVFSVVCGLFLWFSLTNRRIAPAVILVAGLALGGNTLVSRAIAPLLAKEVAVFRGELDVDRSFNGRMTRWKRYLTTWGEMPAPAWLFGVAFSVIEIQPVQYGGRASTNVPAMMAGGMHSDFIRILFFTGIIGMCLYFTLLIKVIMYRRRLSKPDQFLLWSSLAAMLLYSVSTCPTFYSPLMYYMVAIGAYMSLAGSRIAPLMNPAPYGRMPTRPFRHWPHKVGRGLSVNG